MSPSKYFLDTPLKLYIFNVILNVILNEDQWNNMIREALKKKTTFFVTNVKPPLTPPTPPWG